MTKAKKTDWIVSSILFALFALLFLYLGKDSKFPIVYPDEAGYIGWARVLAGEMGDGLHYYPGYALLLAPVFWFTNDITIAYPWFIILNALLGALIPVMLYRLSLCWCKESAVLGRMGISAVASLYPAVTSYIRLAWCETWLTVLFLAMALCMVALQQNRKQFWAWFLLVLCGLWACLTHPRGLMFCLGAVVTAIILLWDKKWLLISGGIGAVLSIGVGIALLLSDSSHIGASHVTQQLLHLVTPSGMVAFLTTMISQFCYLLWSTYGMVMVAIYGGIGVLKRKEKGSILWVFALSSFFFLWCLSALYMSHHARPDHILYGRYMDVAVPLLLLGAFSCWNQKKVPVWVWMISAVVVLTTGLFYAEKTANLDSWVIHCTGLFFYRLLLRSFRFLWTAGLFAVLTFLILWLGRKRKTITVIGIFGLFLFQSVWMQISYFQPESQYKGKALGLVDSFPFEAEIYVAEENFSWEHHNYRVQRPDLNMSVKDEGQPYILSSTLRKTDALIGMEVGRPVYLYSRTDAPKYGKIKKYDADYQWKQTEDGVQITVTNQGSPWLCFQAVKDLRSAVRLSVRQFDEKEAMISDSRLDFSRNLDTGEEETFLVNLEQDCCYVEIQPMIEFNVWFSEQRDTPLLLRRSEYSLEEMVGKTMQSDHSFRRIVFSHLKYANQVEGTTYAGNLIGFYGDDTGAEATVQNIRLPGGKGVLLLETEDQRTDVFVTLNGSKKISAEKYENGAYHFPFAGIDEITSVTIHADTVNPFEESGLPQWMSFLSLDSNLKPVQFAVHRMEDIMGRSVNHHEYGLRLKALEVRLEEAE